MTPALSTLLQDVIDYAGLFPPAALDMPSALRNFQEYRKGLLVNRFCCPSQRLSEVGAGVPVSVIAQPGPWEEARESDARLLNEFQGTGGTIEAYEVAIPDHAGLEGYLLDLRGFDAVEVFVELPWDPSMHDSLAILAQSEYAYAKARTGGERPPTAEDLAGFLHGCVSLDWQFKLTAGLHHPFSVPGRYGLISALGGVALTVGADLSKRELQQVLEAESNQWRFGEETLACYEFEANLDDIEAARDLFRSVGSCSVEEPLEELKSLGLVGGDER